jgi:hypothetical protein
VLHRLGKTRAFRGIRPRKHDRDVLHPTAREADIPSHCVYIR